VYNVQCIDGVCVFPALKEWFNLTVIVIMLYLVFYYQNTNRSFHL